MHRRSSDEVQRKIDEWSLMRGDFGPDAPRAVTDFIDAEIDKLRYEKKMRDRPMPDGRRASDTSATNRRPDGDRSLSPDAWFDVSKEAR